MFSSSALLAGKFSSNPAHRAAVLLRMTLLRSAAAQPKSIQKSPQHAKTSPEIAPAVCPAVSELFEGPVRVTYPHAARLGEFSLEEEAFTGQRDLSFGETPLAPDSEFLRGHSRVEGAEPNADHARSEDDTPPPRPAPQRTELRALVCDFQRRQRHANLLCAGGLASACLFALGGLMLLASFLPDAAAVPAKTDEPVPQSAPAPKKASSIAWHQRTREDGLIGLQFAYMTARDAAKAVNAAPSRKET
jgi:hypothetical protein